MERKILSKGLVSLRRHFARASSKLGFTRRTSTPAATIVMMYRVTQLQPRIQSSRPAETKTAASQTPIVPNAWIILLSLPLGNFGGFISGSVAGVVVTSETHQRAFYLNAFLSSGNLGWAEIAPMADA